MKKIICLLLVLLFSAIQIYAANYKSCGKEIYYTPETNKWSCKQQTKNDIHLTNRGFIGSGGFSEYIYQNGKLAIGPETNIEFIVNGELYGINSHDLKFIKYYYNNGEIKSKILRENEVQELYPDYEIVKISQFKNNEITINKKIFTKKKIILLNDTPNSFYKYSYKPASTNKCNIRTFITLSHPGKIIFSHYGVDTDIFPALKIRVKNKLKCD